MALVILPESPSEKTFQDLDRAGVILGGGALFPFLESVGTIIQSFYQNIEVLNPADEAAIRALEAEFAPHKHGDRVHSYYIDSATNNHLRGADSAAYSFGDAAIDSPFSLGAWILPRDTAAVRSIIAKYRTTAVAAREYDFRVTAAGVLVIELFDESAVASEIGTGAIVLVQNRWAFVCMSYDGNEANPVTQLYVNGVADGAGATVETGAYVAMENTTTPLLVGARDLTASPAQEWEGRIALPFIANKRLLADEVLELHNIGRRLLRLT